MKFYASYHIQSLLLFQLNIHNTLNTYIYHQIPPACLGVYYTIFMETIALLTQKLYAFSNIVT